MVLVVIAALVAVIVAMNRTGPAAPTNAPSAQNTVSHQATEVPFIGLSDPVGVAVDNAGSVYVTDYANVRVLKLAGGSGPQTTLCFLDSAIPMESRWTGWAVFISPMLITTGSSCSLEDRVCRLKSRSRDSTTRWE